MWSGTGASQLSGAALYTVVSPPPFVPVTQSSVLVDVTETSILSVCVPLLLLKIQLKLCFTFCVYTTSYHPEWLAFSEICPPGHSFPTPAPVAETSAPHI